MEQFEKVCKGLECCYMDKSPKHCEGCPYNMDNEGCGHDAFALERDALALIRQQQERIKELGAGQKQEPALLENQHKPYGHFINANSPWISRCPKCGKKVEGKQTRYCKYCGQAVKWE